MNVGIVGLGLIGGSFARAYKESGDDVYVCDVDTNIVDFAVIEGVVKGYLTSETIKFCDLILLSVTPEKAIKYLKENKENFEKNQLVVDCCGIKENICNEGFKIAEKYGFVFAGGHPMAGRQFSGYKNSKADMFKGATMAIIPPKYDDIELFERIKAALLPAKFGRYTIWDAKEHDDIIAFTSQLAHIVSNAYMKSPTAKKHRGLSAGSYKDLTRVAYLNAPMWTELFMENKENILRELEYIINSLGEYKSAIEKDDMKLLEKLLEDGSRLKQEVDKVDKSKC